MIPKKPAPDLIRGGNRFSDKIMLAKTRDHDPIGLTGVRLANGWLRVPDAISAVTRVFDALWQHAMLRR